MVHQIVKDVTIRIKERSQSSRARYEVRLDKMRSAGRAQSHLACGNLAHAFAACPEVEKDKLLSGKARDIAIISAYNDMLSAHQPYHKMLDEVKGYVAGAGGVAQMAGGVPAMCDGVTQGQPGMEMSLFSRDVIAMSTALALSHNVFDGGMLLGVCDKIVPGLLIGALSFGHLPFVFVPAGPMETGISNDEKAKVRQEYAAGKASKEKLLISESRAYHSPGTCTFYGTANSNQMMLEMMGLQLPGSSFVHPHTPLRQALNQKSAEAVMHLALQEKPQGLGDMVNEYSLVNGIVGLLATGGSTNHTLHIVAIAAAAGLRVTWQDFADLSAVVPLLARVYPNGIADVNAFHRAGGVSFVMKQLLEAGLLHADVRTILDCDLASFCSQPSLKDETLIFEPVSFESGDETIIRQKEKPFSAHGGLAVLHGNIGEAIIKTSAVKSDHQVIEAPAIVFDEQDQLIEAFKAGKLNRDFVAVVRFQGPKANGMPELHKLTPSLGVLQDKGYKVALVTDGRMSGASGKVPAAIHVSPEALDGGLIACIHDGDIIKLDSINGTLEVMADLGTRKPVIKPCLDDTFGRDLFAGFRSVAGAASMGASIFPALQQD